MKTIALATLSGLCLVGCTGEADIGVDSQPVACNPDGTSSADMTGEINYNGQTYHFDNATPSFVRTTYATVNLWNYEDPNTQRGNSLRFYFQCGPAQIASYDVVGNLDQQLQCPLEVVSAVAGSIEILPAETGTLIIDQTQGCLAGRFHVEMHNQLGDGELNGWFSIFTQ